MFICWIHDFSPLRCSYSQSIPPSCNFQSIVIITTKSFRWQQFNTINIVSVHVNLGLINSDIRQWWPSSDSYVDLHNLFDQGWWEVSIVDGVYRNQLVTWRAAPCISLYLSCCHYYGHCHSCYVASICVLRYSHIGVYWYLHLYIYMYNIYTSII